MKVALVEPSRTVAQIVTAILEKRSHEVKWFSDANSALEHLKMDEDVDVVITSGELDSRSGLEFCWEARLIAGDRPLHILLMSSSDDRSLVVQALDCGADDFIRKPPVAEELYARLRAAERLARLQRDLHNLATRDGLTGILNRRAFFERGKGVLADGAAAVAAVMMDIDHFKSVNDRFGHATGDLVLVGVAKALERAGALLGRLGGEEFAMIFRQCSRSEAESRAEEARRDVESLAFPGLGENGAALSVTASFGVAEAVAGQSFDQLLHCADMALYRAKQSGRNRTVVYDAGVFEAGQARFRTSDRASSGR